MDRHGHGDGQWRGRAGHHARALVVSPWLSGLSNTQTHQQVFLHLPKNSPLTPNRPVDKFIHPPPLPSPPRTFSRPLLVFSALSRRVAWAQAPARHTNPPSQPVLSVVTPPPSSVRSTGASRPSAGRPPVPAAPTTSSRSTAASRTASVRVALPPRRPRLPPKRLVSYLL